MRPLPLVLALLAATAARADTDCAGLRATFEDARAAVRDCLRGGGSCGSEFARRDAAQAALHAARCPDPNAPVPAQTPPPPPLEAVSLDSVALLVETTSGSATLASKIESRLAETGRTVVSPAEVRAAVRFLGMAIPLDEAALSRLRSELGVAVVVVVSSKAAPGGEHFVMVRTTGSATARRFGTATADAFDDVVLGLLPAKDAPLAASPRKAEMPDVVEKPARTIDLTTPPIDPALDGATLIVERKNGAFYKGVAAREGETLLLRDSTVVHRLPLADVVRFTTVLFGHPPVEPGTLLTLVRKPATRVTGRVSEIGTASVLLATAEGPVRVDWKDSLRIEIAEVRRPREIADVLALGLTPVAAFQPQPKYPPEARRMNVTGSVVLEIVVSSTGRVERMRLLESSPIFDQAALDAVKTWRYEPLVIDGQAVAWRSKVTLRFQLRDE